MLVTFHTKAYADITMFGDVAVKLIKLMGHSGTVPSAILADDVPDALERLKAALAAQRVAPDRSAPEPRSDEPDAEPPVSLTQRAYPLIQLLEAAAERECDVMWSSS